MRRLERCRLHLEDANTRNRPIYEIAHAHGFRDITAFNRLFRKAFGCSPRTLRRNAPTSDQGALPVQQLISPATQQATSPEQHRTVGMNVPGIQGLAETEAAVQLVEGPNRDGVLASLQDVAGVLVKDNGTTAAYFMPLVRLPV